MTNHPDPLTTLTDLLHRDGWQVQLAGARTAPISIPSTPRGVAYLVPASTPPINGDLR